MVQTGHGWHQERKTLKARSAILLAVSALLLINFLVANIYFDLFGCLCALYVWWITRKSQSRPK
jgi:Ca2+/Na+ antiporter